MPKLGKKKKREGAEVPWTPFQEASIPTEFLKETEDMSSQIPLMYLNSRYQVGVFQDQKDPKEKHMKIVHLSIKRIDRSAKHDWRDMQRIKNEIGLVSGIYDGPKCEGVELYPAEERLVDGANQFHIWIVADSRFRFPFGFNERVVCEGSHDNVVQRPFEPGARPDDCETTQPGELRKRYLKEMKRRTEEKKNA